jgi:L-alanine-DL-glutamate epimerase-like enolase superfamily enzyme
LAKDWVDHTSSHTFITPPHRIAQVALKERTWTCQPWTISSHAFSSVVHTTTVFVNLLNNNFVPLEQHLVLAMHWWLCHLISLDLYQLDNLLLST